MFANLGQLLHAELRDRQSILVRPRAYVDHALLAQVQYFQLQRLPQTRPIEVDDARCTEKLDLNDGEYG